MLCRLPCAIRLDQQLQGLHAHLHGGSGFDVMSATVEGMEAWLSDLAKSGVGAVLASPYTSPTEQMRDSLAVIRTVMERQKEGAPGARLLGAHLEGPFISMERPGSMETQYIQPPTEKACRELIEGYEPIIREMTLAPEVPGCGDLVDLLLREGIRVQAGHCDATFGEGEAAFRRGVGSICHFFNGARPIRHRDPGFLTAALVTPDIYCEMITDFVHLDPGAVRLLGPVGSLSYALSHRPATVGGALDAYSKGIYAQYHDVQGSYTQGTSSRVL